MVGSYEICGIAKLNDEFRNIVLNPSSYENKNIKEIIYSTEFGDIEVLFGFQDLNIIELEDSNQIVRDAKIFLSNNEMAQGIVFLEKGYLVITDLLFFSAYVREDGKDKPYTSLVESDTYEDDIALNMIEEDPRLQ